MSYMAGDERSMKPVMVRMPDTLHSKVRQLAEREDRTISWVIRRAVIEYVERKTKGAMR